jgi:hypothetical protein
MTHSDAMQAIRQAATTADLSEVIDAYLEALGEDPADSASETFEETAERFRDAGNTDAYNLLMQQALDGESWKTRKLNRSNLRPRRAYRHPITPIFER